MSSQIHCYACREWFDIKLHACPVCDAPRRGRNSYLETTKLNNQLYAQAEHTQQEIHDYHAVAEGSKNPPKWAYEHAERVLDTW